ncbi:MAG: tetratricopeptide repeat protein [Bryobacteraceae bacterium]
MPGKKIQKVDGRAGTGGAPVRLWPRHTLQIAALWALALAAYSNSFAGGFVFDNVPIVQNDPRIRAATADNIGLIFTWEYWFDSGTSGLYRPLTTLSYLFDYAVLGNGSSPSGYHAVNLALHCLNIALVYALGLAILGDSFPALALAALWAVHPSLVESVTNIVGRADLLAAFGVLAGLLCYMRRASAAGRKRIAWLAALAGAQAIALFSKESGAVLPLLMALADFTWARKETWRNRVVPYAVLILPFAAFFCLRWQLHTHMLVPFSENPLTGAGFWTARMTAVKVIGKYLWLFVWPARLSADYYFNAVPLFGWRPWSWEDAKALIALAACAGLVLLAIRFRRRNRPLFFLLGFFFVALAPASNLFIPIGSMMAERFLYLPSVGLAGCLVIAAAAIARAAHLRRAWWKWAALGFVCLAFGLRTHARNFDWRDDESLWTSAIRAYPESARPHNNLGNLLLARSDLPGAIAELEAALRIRPDYAEAHYNLGKALARMPGRLPQAITEYRAALRDRPDYSPTLHYTYAHISLGDALARAPGRMPDAIAQYEQALKLDPNSAEAHYDLGTALAWMPGKTPEAMAEWQAALRLQPDLAEAHYNLGIVYAQSPDRIEEAAAEYQAALRARPDYAEAYNQLGRVLSRIPGRLADAIAQYQEAVRIQPDFGEAHYNLGMALLQVPGRTQDAIAELEAAWRIRPDPQGRRMIDELRARLR